MIAAPRLAEPRESARAAVLGAKSGYQVPVEL